MITVAILINGQPIMARSAVNRLKETGYYIGDDGSKIKHNPDAGAVKLAIKMLKTIREVDGWPSASCSIDQLQRMPKISFDYDGRTYMFPAKYQTAVELQILYDGSTALWGGWTEQELIAS